MIDSKFWDILFHHTGTTLAMRVFCRSDLTKLLGQAGFKEITAAMKNEIAMHFKLSIAALVDQ